MLLSRALIPITQVTNTDEKARLYFGKIRHSFNAGPYPDPRYIRMTRLHCHADVQDFTLKDLDGKQRAKGISDSSVGRWVIFWGKIGTNGTGLGADRLGWGTYALLPREYERLLVELV